MSRPHLMNCYGTRSGWWTNSLSCSHVKLLFAQRISKRFAMVYSCLLGWFCKILGSFWGHSLEILANLGNLMESPDSRGDNINIGLTPRPDWSQEPPCSGTRISVHDMFQTSPGCSSIKSKWLVFRSLESRPPIEFRNMQKRQFRAYKIKNPK